MKTRPTNMQRDILALNMEQQLSDLASNKYGKSLSACSNKELYYIILDYCKRLLAVTERNTGEKKIYYISAEFLIGKLLSNNLINLKIYDRMNEILAKYGRNLAEIEEAEPEPSLGNGGLGRLAACFLDSIATLGLPGEGIGLNYHYGLFHQVLDDHLQKAEKDPWIEADSWEVRSDVSFDVYFGKRKVTSHMYDIDVIGYDAGVNKLRLFDVDTVDDSLVEEGITFDKDEIEKNLTLFLYPDDSDEKGRLLRIYQQYFMVSNAAQWILREMKAKQYDLRHLYDHAVIQINDTHPTLVIPELIRILTEDKALSMDEAIEVVSQTCAYTNHTILAEALETWPMEYLEKVVPQLVPIIKELDRRVRAKYKDPDVQIIDADGRVHMAYIDIHYGFSVNGVAAIHTEILEDTELHKFYEIYPQKFNNKTNGITFRRWLLSCNHELANYLSETISDAYKKDANRLEDLLQYQNDSAVLDRIGEIKQNNKLALTEYIREHEGVELDPNGIFDIQIKRLHEYKRQQMNALYIIHKYLEIKNGKKPVRPLNFIFGAKAAPAYIIAQDIIHLLLVLQDIINNDPDVNPYMHLVFVTNYNVTYAEKLIPACEISEQISLASKEASGTSNMKFMLNGAVTLGTADGANVEIHDLVGDDNIYMFGIDSETVINHYKNADYVSRDYYEKSPVIKEAVDFIVGPQCMKIGHKENLERLYNDILNKDWFMALIDLEDYIKVKDRMFADYEDRKHWNQMSLVNIAKAGFFSSDRTIAEYNRDIWRLK
ncbi:MAG: glycogen/starch/alpha-glucan phosphorylase [Lachnospiraceae bacterium]|nr:glycogen/starch/alpha-glucan family phosphorylase [Bacillota bacterium]MDY2949163.1 glycogen/starch/alpha-glucan phosphorylase [Lachnospiraceae bacterium]